VQEQAQLLDEGLQSIVQSSSLFCETRGMGLLRALVVADPEKNPPLKYVQKARQAGLLVSRAGKNAVRFLPPLVIQRDEIAHGLKILRDVAVGWGEA
jgi:acetylornithine/succinyldiaminopimelate/putrescine aminotransferase